MSYLYFQYLFEERASTYYTSPQNLIVSGVATLLYLLAKAQSVQYYFFGKVSYFYNIASRSRCGKVIRNRQVDYG